MEKIFHTTTDVYPDSKTALLFILRKFFGIENAKIEKNEKGKPFLVNAPFPLHFSISHTKSNLFIAFSDENVGIDAEETERKTNYTSIIRKFKAEERNEIQSKEDFLRHWTIKESAVKWLGGTLGQDLNKLDFIKNTIYYKEIPLPVTCSTQIFQDCIVSVCSIRDFTHAERIPF